MELKKIKFKKNSFYRPRSKVSYSIIRHPLLLEELDNIKAFCKDRSDLEGEELIKEYFRHEVRIYYNPRMKEVLGWYNLNTNRIDISSKIKNSLTGDFILTHEIGHHLQIKLGLFTFFETRMSKIVQIEQQAETLSYYLYQIFYRQKVCKSHFFRYFREKDIIWLYREQKKISKVINDLFEFTEYGKEQEKKIRKRNPRRA